MITEIGVGVCHGCGAAVNAFSDGSHTVLRDRSLTWAPEHLCDDPERRERVLMDWDDAPTGCPQCGDANVALSTWGRSVDFPVTSIWSDGWVGPLYEHVCGQPFIRGVEVLEL